MTHRWAAALCVLCATSSSAAQVYPPEVAEFLERRELCEHFRQEPWPEGASAGDEERRAFIAAQFERYCSGTDGALEALKRKYGNDRSVLERLDAYEPDIEAK